MAYEDLKDAKPNHDMDDIRPSEFEFYETMVMAPHAIYRDDDDTFLDDERRDELAKQRARLLGLVTIAVGLLVAVGLIVVIGLSLASINGSVGNTSSSSGSLEL